MFLQLAHTKMKAYTQARAFVLECYRVSKVFPADERYAMTQQMRRAALSVYLNIAEGCSRKSDAERKRYFEISRGSVIEIDAILDIAIGLGYCSPESLEELGILMIEYFKLISGLINSTNH